MPAFGKNGIVNLNPSTEKIIWNLIDDKGNKIESCASQEQAEARKKVLSQQLNSTINIQEGRMVCL